MTVPESQPPGASTRYFTFAGATALALVVGVVVAQVMIGGRGGSCDESRLVALPPLALPLAIGSAVGALLLWRRRRVLAWSLGCGGLTMLAWVIFWSLAAIYACGIG